MATKEALQATLQAPRDRGIVPTAVNAESIAWKKGRTGTHPGDPWGLGRGLGLSLDSFYWCIDSSSDSFTIWLFHIVIYYMLFDLDSALDFGCSKMQWLCLFKSVPEIGWNHRAKKTLSKAENLVIQHHLSVIYNVIIMLYPLIPP